MNERIRAPIHSRIRYFITHQRLRYRFISMRKFTWHETNKDACVPVKVQ